MKLTQKFLLACLGSCLFLASGQLLAQQGYVQEVLRGDVKAAVGTGKPVTVVKGQSLANNTTITTGPNSMVVLRFLDGTAIVLNENSSFLIQQYEYNEKSPSTMTALFSMVRGGLRMITGNIASRNREAIKVAVPQATIGIRGTDFMVQLVNPAYLSVIQGAIATTNAAGTAVFSVGSFGTVTSTAALGAAIPASALPSSVAASFSSLSSAAVSAGVSAASSTTGAGTGAGGAGAGGAAGSGAAVGAGVGGVTAGMVGAGVVAVGAIVAVTSNNDEQAVSTPTTTTTSTTP